MIRKTFILFKYKIFRFSNNIVLNFFLRWEKFLYKLTTLPYTYNLRKKEIFKGKRNHISYFSKNTSLKVKHKDNTLVSKKRKNLKNKPLILNLKKQLILKKNTHNKLRRLLLKKKRRVLLKVGILSILFIVLWTKYFFLFLSFIVAIYY